jgi:hypothetical protein
VSSKKSGIRESQPSLYPGPFNKRAFTAVPWVIW